MAVTINEAYVQSFSAEVFEIARRRSKLNNIFMEETAKGELHSFPTFGELQYSIKTDRFSNTAKQEAVVGNRAVATKRFVVKAGIDNMDVTRLLADINSPLTPEVARALGIAKEDEILSEMVGTARTGKGGTGTQAFDTTNMQIAEGATGMTAVKLVEAKKKLILAGVDVSQLYLAITAHGLEDLLNETKVGSIDYNETKVMVNGDVDKFMGINIITLPGTNSTLDIDSNSSRGLLFTPRAMKIAMPKALIVRIGENINEDYNVEVFAEMEMGAVRMSEKEVVDILYAV